MAELLILPLITITANLYTSFAGYISYYLNSVVGFGVVLAGSFVTILRIWDAVTDVGMGRIADKTRTRFGRFSPYMLVGAFGAAGVSILMIFGSPRLPEGGIRKTFFIVLYMVYVIFTTMNVSGLRSTAQVCLEKQKDRATFGMINGIYVVSFYALSAVYVYSYLMPATGGFNLEFFMRLTLVYSVLAVVFTLLYLAVYNRYDRKKVQEVRERKPEEHMTWRQVGELFTKNRPFLMLILSAGTDKLAMILQGNAIVVVILFGIVAGNAKLNSAINGYTLIPNIIMIVLGLGAIGRKYGTRKAMMISSWGGILTGLVSIFLWVFGDARTLGFPGYQGFAGWTAFSATFLVLTLVMKGFTAIGSNCINPMLADIIDYEYYRSGNYCPGTIGALFNLADKIISSLGPTIVSLLCAAIGFREKLPTVEDAYSTPLFLVGLFGMYGMAILGMLVNVICLKFYKLTPEYMDQIHAEIKSRKSVASK